MQDKFDVERASIAEGGTLLARRLLERQMQSDIPSAAESGAATPAPRGDALASEEAILLDAVLKKDRKATAEFVSRYADPVYGYVSQRLAPRADLVEDLVQEVFLVALQKLDTFAGKSSVLGWLLGIARHKVEDLYRARLREPEPLSVTEDESHSEPVILPAVDDLIDRARAQEKTQRTLARLPEVYSLALLWRYWEEQSTREMAAQTGRTEKAMERLLARARAHFRRLWESEGP
jgi:RNA polymerase sigma-70 factor (ECF subfamily)